MALQQKQLFVKIGQRVAALRKVAGVTQAELAESTGLSNETISRLERGVSMPSVEVLVKIADALKVEACSLFTWTEDRDASEKGLLIRSLSDLLSTHSKSDVQTVYDVAVRILKR